MSQSKIQHPEDPDITVTNRRSACDIYLLHLENIMKKAAAENKIFVIGIAHDTKPVSPWNIINAYHEARTGYSAIGDPRIKKLADENPKFKDAIQKYVIVNRLRQTLIGHGLSSEKIQQFDATLNEEDDNEFKMKNKDTITKFPDTGLRKYLKNIGATTLLSIVNKLGSLWRKTDVFMQEVTPSNESRKNPTKGH
jgi:hypothetical protein